MSQPVTQRCKKCGKSKPISAFRLITGTQRQEVCKRCRPALPLPGWRATELAATRRRHEAQQAAAQRRAARAQEAPAVQFTVPAAVEEREARP